MNSREARERLRHYEHANIFISLTDEEGAGPVVAVKDLIDVRGTVTTGGGTILPPMPATEDAPVVQRIRAAGGCVLGKTNLHEWAFGVTSENPHYGPVLNPRDPSRISGGSSGGSAAAVAAGLCDWAIGTDTGGSIRIPASLCGVVGLKPTLGTVSTEGVIPLSWSFDTVGPLAPDVRSAARALEVLSGVAGLVPEGADEVATFRFAIPAGWVAGLDEATQAVWDHVSAGLSEVSLPDPLSLEALYLPIFYVEAALYHRAWIQAYPERYGQDVLGHLRQGLAIPGVDYLAAVRERPAVRAAVEAAMNGYDALLLPTTACVAPPLGTPDLREPLLRFTRPFSFTGHPVLTLPFPVSGLPVGIQVIGHFGRDADLCRIARVLEQQWAGAQVLQSFSPKAPRSPGGTSAHATATTSCSIFGDAVGD